MPSIRVVLLRPENPVNVGASARAMRNAGLTTLALVEPGDWRTLACWRTAWGAHEILERAEVFPDLASAVADAQLVAGFSSRSDRESPSVDVRDLAAELAGLGDDASAALVFGPETAGATLAELAQCGRRVRVPSHPDQPSLNLSHAVAIAGYEIYRARRRPTPVPRRASHADKERVLGLLRAGLEAIQALPREGADAAFEEWRALLQRMELTPHEVKLLEHMARKMARRG